MRSLGLHKVLALLAVASLSMLNAQSIDTANAKAGFTAYKSPKMLAVGGTFNNIVFKFKKGDSIATQLEGASATMEANAINLGDAAKDASLKANFFSQFKKDKKGKQLIRVVFREVVAGENLGTMLASVSMNGKSQKVSMQYTIQDGTLTAKGVIDVLDFGLSEAFAKLAKACEALHEGRSWTQVEIYFSAPVK